MNIIYRRATGNLITRSHIVHTKYAALPIKSSSTSISYYNICVYMCRMHIVRFLCGNSSKAWLPQKGLLVYQTDKQCTSGVQHCHMNVY